MEWKKSSYSSARGNCVEVAATWRKSSYSSAEGNCVECRTDAGRVLIRDTQNLELGHLAVPAAEWRAFLAEVDAL